MREQQMIEMTLPYPPSANRYWRHWNNRVVMSAEARAYKNLVSLLAKAQNVDLVDGTVCVELEIYRPRQAGDIDNSIKILLDALNKVAYSDDSQIVRLVADQLDDKENPRVEVRVTPMTRRSK
jgi:crossover junction endodeoxyribonuclease RusA